MHSFQYNIQILGESLQVIFSNSLNDQKQIHNIKFSIKHKHQLDLYKRWEAGTCEGFDISAWMPFCFLATFKLIDKLFKL